MDLEVIEIGLVIRGLNNLYEVLNSNCMIYQKKKRCIETNGVNMICFCEYMQCVLLQQQTGTTNLTNVIFILS